MPTTDFFSGPGFEPEDVPVKKTSPAQQPVEKQPADDEPFAGMQKLDFDFLGGDDPAVPGETDPGDPFDDFSFQRPAAPAGPAQPARRPSCSMKSLPPRRSAACRKRALPRRRPLPSEGRMMHPFGLSLRRRLRPRRLRSCSILTMRLWSVPHPGRRRPQLLPERPRLISAFRKKSPRRLLPPHRWTATRRCLWIFWTMRNPLLLCRPRPRRL